MDIQPQPRYAGDRFIQADVMALLYHRSWLRQFDAIHASPPCQRYSPISRYQRVADNYPDLVAAVREGLMEAGVPAVIENVPQAPIRADVVLCGQQFGLPIYRHRAFEGIGVQLSSPPPCTHPYASRQSWSGWHLLENGVITVVGHTYRLAEGKVAMGIDWMHSREELNEAIPPAYTRWIGGRLLTEISRSDPLTASAIGL